ncbi:MAG: M1 family aminopeptidase [Acidimicrobiales bacterium]
MRTKLPRILSRFALVAGIASASIAIIPTVAKASGTDGQGSSPHCSAGAHTLSDYGSVMYPETGNGGYVSVHTDVYMVYDAATNTFLPGNHVRLFERATQCLSSFSLDFERSSQNESAGPHMLVDSVTVDGAAAAFVFVQPTYPGDPHGMNDPDSEAHEVSQTDPVGGPDHDPLPPACSPELLSEKASARFSEDGEQCPANKLVITPRSPIRDGTEFTVEVDYTGRPGIHNDGDGEVEGWYRTPDGGFVESEPLGTEDWMPLNNYPTAKPTYDFYDTVATGKTAVANGYLLGIEHHPPSTAFPHGSVTWHWLSGAPVANYLVENSVGDYTITQERIDGIRFYEVLEDDIPIDERAHDLSIMEKQPGITTFESGFLGIPFPFESDGIIVSTAHINSAEEMQTMITFGYGWLGLDTLYHENMHQWWGDNVTEASYSMTFFKEGMATVGQWLLYARQAEAAAGGPGTAAGRAAFNHVLVKRFDLVYDNKARFMWSTAPSDPSPWSLWNSDPTYSRPAAMYLALRQILGYSNWTAALDQIQRQHGGKNIDESELESAFHDHMPNRSASCQAHLAEFFKEWLDTSYPVGTQRTSQPNRPQITGPGLDGPGFYNSSGGCAKSGLST